MNLKKDEAEFLKTRFIKNLSWETTKSKFLKQFGYKLFSNDSDEVRRAVRDKLNIDFFDLIPASELDDDTILWKYYGINSVCKKCVHTCKQHNGAILEYCPKLEVIKHE